MTGDPKSHEVRNLFSGIPKVLPEEAFTDLLKRPGVRIERIVSRGHETPSDEWYDQDDGEWVMVVTGAARLRFHGEDEDRSMGPGDYIYIPPHVRHRVTWTDPEADTVWLAVFISL